MEYAGCKLSQLLRIPRWAIRFERKASIFHSSMHIPGVDCKGAEYIVLEQSIMYKRGKNR